MPLTLFSVQINGLFLVLALALLWLPRQWLRLGSFSSGRGRSQRSRSWTPTHEREPGDFTVRIGEEMTKGRNWLDFFRALAGGSAVGGTLMAGVAVFTAVEAKPDQATLNLILALKITVLVVGVLVQLLRYEGKLTLFAPLFYLQGLAFGLAGTKTALLAIGGVWTLNAVLPSAAIFLFVFAGLELILGLVFAQQSGDVQGVVVAAGLSLLPGAFSLLGKRRLAQFTKKTKIIISSSDRS